MIYYIAGLLFIIGGIFRSVFYEKAFMTLIGFVLYWLGKLNEITEYLEKNIYLFKRFKYIRKIIKKWWKIASRKKHVL